MGARPEDYAAVAPLHSYIHVDDFESPKELAAYLEKLNADDRLYNEYFAWKGTGEFINTKFWCRLCTMVHASRDALGNSHVIDDPENWWRRPGVCIMPDKKPYSTWRRDV